MKKSSSCKDTDTKLLVDARSKNVPWTRVALLSLIVMTCVSSSTLYETTSTFRDVGSVKMSVAADKLASPTNLVVKNERVGETDLSWKVSPTSYITGHKVLRSDSVYGPWTTLATLSKTTTTYTDKTGGSKQWIYRVEAVYQDWLSESPGFESPPPVGTEFFDSFPGGVRSLDGARTEDGKSVWQLWAGDLRYTTSGWLNDYGNSTVDSPSIGVVRTPAHDAALFMTDMDGVERFIIRGKDPKNYIYAGGIGGDGYYGTFEITEVRNGVRNVLVSKKTASDNQNMRIEVRGSSIKAYTGAKANDLTSGVLHTEATTDFLKDDPTATYFGFGFAKSDFGILDFTFKAL